MKFLYRLGFFLGGFSIGLIMLFYVWGHKNVTFNYLPNSRVLNDLRKKKWQFEGEALTAFQNKLIDSTEIARLFKEGDVDFSESETRREGCKRYLIENEEATRSFWVRNCKQTVFIESFKDLQP